MPQVPAEKTPHTAEELARCIDRALIKYMGASSLLATAKVLAFKMLEVGGAKLRSMWNHNPGNYRVSDKESQTWFWHPGNVTEFDSSGKPIPNPDKSFRAYPDLQTAVDSIVGGIKRRWPAALVAALDDSASIDAMTEALLSKGVGNSGKPGTWPPYAAAGNNPTTRAQYLKGVRDLFPVALAAAQVANISPKAERGGT